MSKEFFLNLTIGVLLLEILVRFMPSIILVGLMFFCSMMKVQGKNDKKEIV